MRIFDRYILGQMLKPLAIALLIALLVLLLERMLRVLDFVLGAQGPVRVVFELLAYLLPHYLGIALPMAFFLGVFLAFNRLSQDSELDALSNAGAGLPRLMRPVFLAALCLTLMAAVIFDYLQPHSRYAYRAVVFAVTNASFQALLQEGVFVTADRTTFLVERMSRDKQEYHGVFVYRELPSGETLAITARNGVLEPGGHNAPPLVRLFDGVQLAVPAEEATPAQQRRDGVLHFDELRTTIGEGAYEAFRPRGRDNRELTLSELWQLRDQPPDGESRERLISEFNERLVRILSVMVMPFLAMPLALGRRRSHRSYGLVTGIVALILFNEILGAGAKMVNRGQADPGLAIWGPFVVFLALSVVLYFRAAYRVPRHESASPLEMIMVRAGLSGPRRQSTAEEPGQ